jgi:manganese/zinc/iron transport system permease protein
MEWYVIDTWIVLTGAVCAIACALPGCFLVLRQMSMMGDAISHAVLPGLAIAFLVTGSRSSFGMFVGAGAVGVMTAVFTQWISQFGKVDRGAAMGVVFTTLFAAGLVLIVQAADHVDLDPGCVLYGALEFTPLEIGLVLGGLEIPSAFIKMCIILLLNVAVITLLYKEFVISSFDPSLAATLNMRPNVMHYTLMTLVSVTVVAAFEAVGSIIVIAMLIGPPSTAYLLSSRLSTMLVLSAIFATLAALGGHVCALVVPPLLGFDGTSTSGMMATVSGVFFAVVWCGVLIARVRNSSLQTGGEG